MKPSFILLLGLFVRLLGASYVSALGAEGGLGDGDAYIFYVRILTILQTGEFETFSTGASWVLNFLSLFLWPFGDALIVVCLVVCAIWFAAGKLFLACLNLLSLSPKQKLWAVTFFSLWPTAVSYTSIPLRESFELFFVNLSVFGALSLIVHRRLHNWLWVFLGCVFAGSLHGALAANGLAAIGTTALFYSLTTGRQFPVIRIAAGCVLALGILYFSDQIISNTSYDLSSGTLSSIDKLQAGGLTESGRATYKNESIGLDFVQALVALPIGLFQYLFEPLPQRIQTLPDLVLALENLTRLFFLLMIPSTLKRVGSTRETRVLLFIVTLYFVQEAIWSVGTINWGTASRHHIPAMGSLILIAAHLHVFGGRARKISAASTTNIFPNAGGA